MRCGEEIGIVGVRGVVWSGVRAVRVPGCDSCHRCTRTVQVRQTDRAGSVLSLCGATVLGIRTHIYKTTTTNAKK